MIVFLDSKRKCDLMANIGQTHTLVHKGNIHGLCNTTSVWCQWVGLMGLLASLITQTCRVLSVFSIGDWLYSWVLILVEQGHWEQNRNKQKMRPFSSYIQRCDQPWLVWAWCIQTSAHALPWLVMAPLSKPIPIYKLHEAFCLSFLYALLSALTFLCYGVEYFKYRLLSVQTESVYRVSLLGSARPIPYQVS